jgi:hypothetical protein
LDNFLAVCSVTTARNNSKARLWIKKSFVWDFLNDIIYGDATIDYRCDNRRFGCLPTIVKFQPQLLKT